MEAKRIVIPYTPRPLQLRVHNERKRFAVLVCHRRFGKTVCAVNDLMRQALRYGGREWRAGYLAPWLKQAKSVAWDYLKWYAGVLPGARFNESELAAMLPNGARIRLYGADNDQAIRGEYFNDLVVDEAGDIMRATWSQVLRPAIADKQGRVLFLGTPKGTENLLYDRWQMGQGNPESWSTFMFKASETGYLPAEELLLARQDMTEDEYNQEFECSFSAAIQGAYFGRILDQMERDGKVCRVSYEPGLLVYTAWDLGMDDATAIWFFQIEPGGDWRVIDYYENCGEGLAHYAEILVRKGYSYGRHIAPHDIRVREIGTGKSRLDAARALGVRFDIAPNASLADGINAVRQKLPRMWFDAGKCAEGLKALRNYRKEWRPQLETFNSKPLHNWSSHAADALRMAVLGAREDKKEPRQEYAERRKR